jgi:hypothetical protein
MAKLIQNIRSTNDGEQHKNNTNIVKYLESNKESILGLAKKNYENLVDVLTNSAKNAVSASSSSLNPTLSLLQSSSPTFPNLSDQSDNYRIEESEIYYNSKGDIAD